MVLYKNIYLYHLDYEIQTLFCLERSHDKRQIDEAFEMVTKMAVLLCEDSVIFPASNYFESDFAFNMLNNISGSDLLGPECFKLISSSYNIDELLDRKRIQHGENLGKGGYHYFDFIFPEKKICLPGTLVKRNSSASLDIKSAILSDKGRNELARTIYKAFPKEYQASKVEQIIADIPSKLGETAYISRYISPLFVPTAENESKLDNIINRFITREYIRSFLDEYQAVCFVDVPLLSNAQLILPPEPEYEYISYLKYARALRNITYKSWNGYDYVKKCTLSELYEFKFSDVWKKVCNPTPVMFRANCKELQMKNNKEKVTIGIITALPTEFAAVQQMLTEAVEEYDMHHDKGNRYLIALLKSADKKEHYISLVLCGEGNNNAAIRCTEMIDYFPNVKFIIMCGIAGGIPSSQNPEDHVRLGDIVVSTDVLQYDYGKETDNGFELKAIRGKVAASLQKAINKIKTEAILGHEDWHVKLDEYAKNAFAKPDVNEDKLYDEKGSLIHHPYDSKRTSYPKVHFGTIASANVVQKKASKRDEIRDKYGAKAAEMEGSGIVDASWNGNVGFVIVRGICDYCDSHKNNIWQGYAAVVAAAYTIHIIENMPAYKEIVEF